MGRRPPGLSAGDGGGPAHSGAAATSPVITPPTAGQLVTVTPRDLPGQRAPLQLLRTTARPEVEHRRGCPRRSQSHRPHPGGPPVSPTTPWRTPSLTDHTLADPQSHLPHPGGPPVSPTLGCPRRSQSHRSHLGGPSVSPTTPWRTLSLTDHTLADPQSHPTLGCPRRSQSHRSTLADPQSHRPHLPWRTLSLTDHTYPGGPSTWIDCSLPQSRVQPAARHRSTLGYISRLHPLHASGQPQCPTMPATQHTLLGTPASQAPGAAAGCADFERGRHTCASVHMKDKTNEK